jgi:four helix bundle protein
MRIYFDHEKLDVYQESLKFAAWCEPLLERGAKGAAVHNQLDRARTSIVLNIPEGNGKFTSADRCKYFDNARGSALECAGCLDLLVIKKLLNEQEMDEGKTSLRKIVSMLVGLIKSNDPSRLHEEPVEYRVERND